VADGAGRLNLTVLGAGPAYTDRPGASGASYLVRTDHTALLLDLGQGSFPRLAAAVEPSTLNAVVISHLHPDHFVDLVPLRHYLAYEFRPARHVRVIGPAGLATRLDDLHARAGFAAATLDCETFTDTVAIGELILEARRVTHTEDSHAVRIVGRGSAGLVYSGDCGRIDDLVPLIKPGDTLLVEISFGLGPVPRDALHLDAPGVIELVHRTNPGRVLLTHIQMGHDRVETVRAVQASTAVPVTLVEPGDEIDLRRA
jgi:ribonuclease BN (tRNA processing enzyme)